jgi:hypothetical protein
MGDGSDENLIMNLDDTSNQVVFTTGTGLNLATFTGIALDSSTYIDADNYRVDNTLVVDYNTTSGSVMLGALAGSTLTGNTTFNVALGYEAGRYASTTSADSNRYVGYQAGYYNSSFGNSLIGSAAGYRNSGSGNNLLGNSAGYNNTGTSNNFIGGNTGYANTGNNNNFIGYEAGYENTGSTSVMMGYKAGRYLKASSTVAIGGEALYGSGGSAYFGANNVAVGFRAGYAADTGAYNNILLGYQVADNLTTGNNNIIIGYDVDSPTATADNILNIGNILFGTAIDATGTTVDANATIGIGTSTPWKRFSVSGDAVITGALFGNNGSAGTNGMVLQTTGTGFNWVSTSSLNISGGGGLTSADIDTSAELDTIVGDDTGSGALVFAGSPTFTGTANFSSLIASASSTIAGLSFTNATGTSLYIGGDRITDFVGTGLSLSGTTLTASLGTNIASAEIADGDHGFFSYASGVASLDTGGLTSANLLASLTDETGTGRAVFSISPAFSGTPTFAALTATSTLTLSGTAANIALGSNYLSGDGDDEGVYVTSAGLVGIGTSTPNQKLSIFTSGGDAALEFSSLTGSPYKWTAGIDYSDAGKFKISSSSALGTNDRFVIDGSGNVGIGTSTPSSAKLSTYLSATTQNNGVDYGLRTIVRKDDGGISMLSPDVVYGTYTDLIRTDSANGSTRYSYGNYISVVGTTAATSYNYGTYVTVSGADNNYSGVFLGGNFGVGDVTPDAYLDMDAPTTFTSGTLYGAGAAGATTLAGALTGFDMNLSTNYTATGFGVTGFNTTLPTVTNTGAATYTYRGLTVTGSAITSNGASTANIFTGAFITNPNLTQTSGTASANGVSVTTGTNTTGGTQQGFNVIAQGVSAGTLNGLNIGAITGAGGTETAISVGTGWDNTIDTNGFDVTGSGAVTAASLTLTTDLTVANGGTGLSTFGGTNLILYTTAADTLSSEAAFTYTAGTNTFGVDIITLTNTGTINGLDAVDATGEDTIEALIFDADAQNITGVWEVADDTNFDFGTDADWHIEYDEGVDNQLLFQTAAGAAVAITDAMFEILVDAAPTANQQIFGVAKGSQAANTELFTVDEDGDGVFGGTLTEAGSAVQSAADLDTCAEFAALGVIETGTCGSLVLSISPAITGTLDVEASDFSGTMTLSGAAANIALGSNFLSNDGADEGISIGTTGAVTVTPATAFTTGTLISAAAGGATTLSGAYTGANLNLNTNFTATGFSVTGYAVTTPAVTNVGSNPYTYRGLEVTGGAITQTTLAGANTFTGAFITSPNITQTTGTIVSNGVSVTTGTNTTGGTQNGFSVIGQGVSAGTLNGININSITGAGGTENAIAIGTGYDNILNTTPFDIAGTGATTIAPLTTFTSGNIIGVAAGGATTLTGGLSGIDMNLLTNYTVTGMSVNGFNVALPSVTNTGVGTYTYRGLVVTGSAITQNTAAGVDTFTGAFITNSNITQTTGTVSANGISVTTGSITTGGTQQGLNVIAAGVGAGTLNGLNIGAITAGAGTESAIVVGTGWDNTIDTNGFDVTGSGAVTAASLALTGATQGSVFFAGASGVLAQDNVNLFFNDTTNRLGLGTTTPNQIITAYGTNPQLSFSESGTEFLRAGVGETANTSVIGWDDSDSLRLGVYDSPYDTSISSLMTILSTGNVGIGTTTPEANLNIYDTNDDTSLLIIEGTGLSGNSALDLIAPLSTGVSDGKAFSVRAVGESFGRLLFYTDGKFGMGPGSGTRDVFLSRSAANTMRLSSDASNGAATLLVNGSIGIGDTSLSQLLDIDGTNPQALFEESTTEFLRTGVGETAGTSVIGWDDSDTIHFGVYDSPTDATITSHFNINSTGLLTFASADVTNEIGITGTGDASDPQYTFTSDGDTGMYSSAANTLNFTTAGAIGLTITDYNWLLYPGADVSNEIDLLQTSAPSASDPALSFGSSEDTGLYSSATGYLNFTISGTHRMALSATGLGVGTSTPNKRFQILDTVADDQFRISYDATRYTDFQVDSSGDMIIDAQGGDVSLLDENVFICAGGSCPSGTPTGQGNLVVERGLGVSTSTPITGISVGVDSAIHVYEKNVSDAAPITLDWNQGNQQLIRLAASRTVNFTNVKPGQTLRLVVCRTAGSYTVTWGSTIRWDNGTTPTQTTTSNKCDVFSFIGTLGHTGTAAVIFGSSNLNF